MSHTLLSIRINGDPRSVASATVSELLAEVGLSPARPGIAVAIEGALVPRAAWGETRIEDGQTVEIITASQGG
jgi:sulfur carrier protein